VLGAVLMGSLSQRFGLRLLLAAAALVSCAAAGKQPRIARSLSTELDALNLTLPVAERRQGGKRRAKPSARAAREGIGGIASRSRAVQQPHWQARGENFSRFEKSGRSVLLSDVKTLRFLGI
jgi:hypothetical protein